MSNVILERINQVLVNLVRTCNIYQTYVDKDDSWLGILSAAAFTIISTKTRLKGYSPGQLVLVHDMVLLIKHTVDWKLIVQQKQTQMNKENILENRKWVDYDYNVGDKVILNNYAS